MKALGGAIPDAMRKFVGVLADPDPTLRTLLAGLSQGSGISVADCIEFLVVDYMARAEARKALKLLPQPLGVTVPEWGLLRGENLFLYLIDLHIQQMALEKQKEIERGAAPKREGPDEKHSTPSTTTEATKRRMEHASSGFRKR